MRSAGVVMACAIWLCAYGCKKKEPVTEGDVTTTAAATASAEDKPDDIPPPPQTAIATAAQSAKASDAPTPSAPLERKALIFQAFTSDDLEGKLHREDVSKTFDDNAAKLTACLTTDAVIKVKLKVLPSGRVADARVTDATPNDPKLRDCIAAVLRGLTFPRLKGSEPASVALDLALKKAP